MILVYDKHQNDARVLIYATNSVGTKCPHKDSKT